MTTAERILVGVMVIQTFALAALFAYMVVIDRNVLESEEISTVNQAVLCQTLLVLGTELDEDGPCFEPDVLGYYDPANPGAISTSLERQCAILAEVAPEKVDEFCVSLGFGG